MSSKKNIEDTKPIDVLADRVWAGDRYYYPGIERMIAELTRLRSRAAEAHQWEEMAERTGLPLKPDGAEAEIARLREIESQAKAAGFMYDDGEFVDMAIVRRAAARSLIQAMRFVSEEAYSAAWMGGLEFDLFDVCMNGSGDYGSVEVTTDMVSELLILGRLAGGWPVRDDIEGQTIMPMDQWREQYYKWRARKCGYGEGKQ